jgi:hypothetical protein
MCKDSSHNAKEWLVCLGSSMKEMSFFAQFYRIACFLLEKKKDNNYFGLMKQLEQRKRDMTV